MKKPPVRTGIYEPPAKTLPFIALVISAEGRQKVKTFATRKEAIAFTQKYEAEFDVQPEKNVVSGTRKPARNLKRTGKANAKVHRAR